MTKKTKTVTVLVTMNVPIGFNAKNIPREVRELVRNGAGYFTYPGECFRAVKVRNYRAK